MDTKIQAEKRTAEIQKIISALISGRRLSVYNGNEFAVSEMHTCFCVIRNKIRAQLITGYTMKDVWKTNENGIRYKEYWFEPINGTVCRTR